MRLTQPVAFILLALPLAGCATKNTRVFYPDDINMDLGSPTPNPDRLKQVNLPKFIAEPATDLDDAFRLFRSRCQGTCRTERNAIQDRLIAASNAICRDYKGALKQTHANWNLFWGSATTVLGGVGALVQPVDLSRLFAGAASVSSGLRAEYNQTVYSTLAVEIVTKAIDKTRNDKLKEITTEQERELANYSLERAVSDVVVYHDRCSLLAGLQEASTAVSLSENLGLRTLNQTLAELGQSMQLPLGKRSYDLFSTNTAFLVGACRETRAAYDAFVAARQINDTDADFVAIIKTWKDRFESQDYCKDFASVPSHAADIDQEWTSLIGQFTAQTDPKEKERVVGLLTAQQTKVRAITSTLTNWLQGTFKDLDGVARQLEAARRAIERVQGGLDEVKGQLAAGKDPSGLRSVLGVLSANVRSAVDVARGTKAFALSQAEIDGLKPALVTIDTLRAESAPPDVQAAADALRDLLLKLQKWGLKAA